MDFTAIHRALGLEPGPLTDDMLNSAVSARVEETHDLDWKRDLPPTRQLADSDFPKDVAAMANGGGGALVYGVTETGKKADGRRDVGDLDERHEATLRRAAVTAIVPPVFGLQIVRLGVDPRAVAVIVPASVDGPHLIHRQEFFGAPIRNDSDTTWMREREIDAAYRARFEDQRSATEGLADLYDDVAESRRVLGAVDPWMICVARPRLRVHGRPRLTREDVEGLWTAVDQRMGYSHSGFQHPVNRLDTHDPRAGLRRWVIPPQEPATAENGWREAWAAFHDDGSVTLAGAVNGRPGETVRHDLVDSVNVEAYVADFMALVYAAGLHHGLDEYEVMLGMNTSGNHALRFQTVDTNGFPYSEKSLPIGSRSRVTATVSTQATDAAYHRSVYDLALDAVNQGGITYLRCISPPPQG
jgi:hypothetical protein